MSAISRIRSRWLIVLGLLALVVGGTLFWLLWQGELESQLADLRSQGLPTNSKELNAWYRVPDGITDTTELWVAAIEVVTKADVNLKGAKLPIVGENGTPIPAPGENWDQLEASRAFLNELTGEMQLIRQAAAGRGVARYPIDFSDGLNTPLPYFSDIRTVSRLLTLSAHTNAHEGQNTLALRDVLDVFATSDSLSAEPVWISQLVRIAVHAVGCYLAVELLPHCNWDDAELAELQRAIAVAEFRGEMLRALRGEQAMLLTYLREDPSVYFRSANATASNELFGIVADGLAESWPKGFAASNEIDVELKRRMGGAFTRLKHMHVQMSFPAVHHAVQAGARAEARRNSAIIAIAAHRYRTRHGVYPNSVNQLLDLIPGDERRTQAVLLDPFDGKPLRYQVVGSQLLVYSIGDNQIDDGGAIIATEETQLAPDIGFKLEN